MRSMNVWDMTLPSSKQVLTVGKSLSRRLLPPLMTSMSSSTIVHLISELKFLVSVIFDLCSNNALNKVYR